MQLTVNGEVMDFDGDESMPILWFLRDHLNITTPKFGCGGGFCGACTVHLDGEPIRSCSTTMAEAVGKKITTLEGLPLVIAKPIQEAWVAEEVPQCGYCQCGQIMSAAALLAKKKNPNDEDINKAMKGNLCRCGTYSRIRKAIQRAAKAIA